MNVDDVHQILAKVKIGQVGLGLDWRYYITSGLGDPAVECDDEVYRLADDGLVHLEPDGPVSHTRAGRRRYEAHLRAKAAERAAVMAAQWARQAACGKRAA